MKQPDPSTQDHKSHMDTAGFTDIDGTFHSVRNTGGRIGVDSVDGKHYLSVYDSSTGSHHRLAVEPFNTESDARDEIASQYQSIRSSTVVRDEQPASWGEMKQAEANKERRAKEAADPYWSPREGM